MFLSLWRRHEGWLSLILVSALLVLGFVSFQTLFSYETPPPATPVPVAQRGAPTLALYPDHGPGGTYVSVTGNSWPGSAEVTILLANAQGQSTVLVKRVTTADGRLSTGFLYPFNQQWLTPAGYSVIAESSANNIRVTTPFQVSDSPLPATATPTVTTTTITPTATLAATPTALPTATATEMVAPTPVPSPTPTATTIPTPEPTATPLPTDTPLPVANQPPQVQAALVPIDIDDDRRAGVFAIQVAATDPEGDQPGVVTILQLPLGDRERKVKLKESKKTEIKFTNKELEIKAPDPQAVLDQLTAYGGVVVENEQQIDLRIKEKNEGKLVWEDDHWRLEGRAIQLTVIATDAAGGSSRIQVNSCLDEDCPATDE